MKFLKKLPLWVKIIGGIIVFIIFLFGLFAITVFALFYNPEQKQAEKLIEKKFYQEVSQLPQLKVNSFSLWEGDSIVLAEVEGKGMVNFWYGKSGYPRIMTIDSVETSSYCYYADTNEYAYTTSLTLYKGSKFQQWFPFEINNLKDLVDRYNDIVAVLKTFRSSEIANFTDEYKGREVKCNVFSR